MGFDGRTSYPRKRRWKIFAAIFGERLNLVAHSTLSPVELDQAIFATTKCPPTTSLADLRAAGASTRGALLKMLKREAEKPYGQSMIDKLVVGDAITGLTRVAQQEGAGLSDKTPIGA